MLGIDIHMTMAQATATASVVVGILIVTMFGLAAYLFVKLVTWWWDQ